jgi:hypothetical protein
LKLYEISDDIERVMNAGTDKETGEITDECIAALDALGQQLKDKALAVAKYMLGEQVEGEAIEKRAKQMMERAQVHKNRATRLKRYLEVNLKGEAFSDAEVSIGYRNASSVEIFNDRILPDIYLTEQEPKPNKVEIGRVLRSGETVDGARLVTVRHMQVK